MRFPKVETSACIVVIVIRSPSFLIQRLSTKLGLHSMIRSIYGSARTVRPVPQTSGRHLDSFGPVRLAPYRVGLDFPCVWRGQIFGKWSESDGACVVSTELPTGLSRDKSTIYCRLGPGQISNCRPFRAPWQLCELGTARARVGNPLGKAGALPAASPLRRARTRLARTRGLSSPSAMRSRL